MSFRPLFARAAAIMTRVGGEVVRYEQRSGGPPLSISAVFSQPEEVNFSVGGGRSAVRMEATIAAADIAPGRPEPGDLIGLGSERGWRVETVRQDAAAVLFTLGLSRQG